MISDLFSVLLLFYQYFYLLILLILVSFLANLFCAFDVVLFICNKYVYLYNNKYVYDVFYNLCIYFILFYF